MQQSSTLEARTSPTGDPAFKVTSHSHHARLRKIEFSRAALEKFFAVADRIEVQNLEYVPFMRFALGATLADVAGRDFAETLIVLVRDRAIGGFEIGVKGVRDDPDSYVKFGTAVGHLIGPANHDAMSNKYYARFLVKDTDSSDSYLRQAYRAFTLHTDGTFVDEATDWLLMMKFAEENAAGGETRLLHLDDWAELNGFATEYLGRKSFVYKTPGSKNVEHMVERPLFFETEHGLSVSFIDQFVQPRTIEEALFLKDFSTAMEASPATIETPVPVGSLVVVNIYFWLHGCAAFRKNPGLHRELLRLRSMFAQ